MNEQPTDILSVLALLAAVIIGLGAIIWQIFRAEKTSAKTVKKNRPI
jgi:Na+-transporting methylmalonyl-CoA/oxaloacetate decarboxylase gamma subunit